MWTAHERDAASLEDIDPLFDAFAEACAGAGEACALSHLGSGPAILRALDGLIDSLYTSPVPALSPSNVPGLLVRSYHARQAMFLAMYGVGSWPSLAASLADALKGNYTQLLQATLAPSALDGTWKSAARRPDYSHQATLAIRCADQSPYSADDPPPASADVADGVLDALATQSRRAGEDLIIFQWCHVWRAEKKSFYGGTFGLEEGALQTPALILSQRLDPVTREWRAGSARAL